MAGATSLRMGTTTSCVAPGDPADGDGRARRLVVRRSAGCDLDAGDFSIVGLRRMARAPVAPQRAAGPGRGRNRDRAAAVAGTPSLCLYRLELRQRGGAGRRGRQHAARDVAAPMVIFHHSSDVELDWLIRRTPLVDPRVADALAAVDRRHFVSGWLSRRRAYVDTSLPLDAGQRIGQPSFTAQMISAARIAPGARVLEIGSGSGWGAAILAK